MSNKMTQDIDSEEVTDIFPDDEKKSRTTGWWAKLNAKCLQCSKSCKQSSKVVLVHCPQFTKQEGER